MSLSKLIRKRESVEVATATIAIPATNRVQEIEPAAVATAIPATVATIPPPAQALEALRTIHARQAANLLAAGIDGVARVLLSDWRAALGTDEFDFHNLVLDLEQSGQVIREHGLARPRETT